MANAFSGTAQIDDRVPAELVAATTYETARAGVVAQAFVAYDEISGSLVKSYTRFGKVTAAAMTQGTDVDTTAMSDSQVSLTLAEIGIGVELGDVLSVASGVGNELEMVAGELGKAYSDKVEIDILAKFASLTDSVGSTGVALTEDVWMQGIYECEANDINGRQLAFIGYPKQIHNLRTAIAGVTENQSNVYSRADWLTPFAPAKPGGFVFNWLSVDIFQSTNVPSANAAADSKGAFVVPGPGCPIMLAVGVDRTTGKPWWARTAYERNESMRATEIWVTGLIACGVPAPERGCGVLSVR